MNKYLIILTLINTFLLVLGQIFWKIGIQKVGNLSLDSFFDLIFSLYIWVGLLIYVVATVIWFKILSMGSFSVVYPLQSFSYILSIIVACVVFSESIPLTRWLGGSVILIGIYLVTLE